MIRVIRVRAGISLIAITRTENVKVQRSHVCETCETNLIFQSPRFWPRISREIHHETLVQNRPAVFK